MKLTLALLIMAMSIFAQNTTYKDGTECNCDSIGRDYYESGELLREMPITKTGHTGVIKTYYKSGSIKMSEVVVSGINKGKWITYYESGSIEVEATMNDTLVIGIGNWYRENGTLISVENYSIAGKLNGIRKWYFENGDIAGTATYKNGELIGYKKCADGRVGNESLDCLN